jgi:prepilin-type N-terminal cleavage/methylation domain-containing protein
MQTHGRHAASTTARLASARRAVTLLEIIAVVVIIGIVAASVATRFGFSTIANTGAEGFARELSMDCLQARRRAISTGNDHTVRFTVSGGKATQYAVYRRGSSGDVLVDQAHFVPDDVIVTPNSTDFEFTFTGDTLAPYTAVVQGPDRSWNVTVVQATGKALVTEL